MFCFTLISNASYKSKSSWATVLYAITSFKPSGNGYSIRFYTIKTLCNFSFDIVQVSLWNIKIIRHFVPWWVTTSTKDKIITVFTVCDDYPITYYHNIITLQWLCGNNWIIMFIDLNFMSVSLWLCRHGKVVPQ